MQLGLCWSLGTPEGSSWGCLGSLSPEAFTFRALGFVECPVSHGEHLWLQHHLGTWHSLWTPAAGLIRLRCLPLGDKPTIQADTYLGSGRGGTRGEGAEWACRRLLTQWRCGLPGL